MNNAKGLWVLAACAVVAVAVFSCGKQGAGNAAASGSAAAQGGTAPVAAAVTTPADEATVPGGGAAALADGAGALGAGLQDSANTEQTAQTVRLRGVMNDMRVNVRDSASIDGAVLGMAHRGNLFTVTGFSDETVVGGTTGHWVHVELPCNDGDGWIFSPYIDVSEFPQYTTRELPVADGITVTGFQKDSEEHGDYEDVTLNLALANGMFADGDGANCGAFRYKDQPFYSFWLRTAGGGANTYAWHEGDQTVRYVTSAIASEGGPGGIVSEDYNFLICDVGSAPGIRGVEVIDLNTGALLCRCAYYHDFEYEAHELTVVGTRMRQTDAERKAAADRYNEEHPYSAEEQRAASGGLTISVIELFRYNFVTNEYRPLGLRRIITQ